MAADIGCTTCQLCYALLHTISGGLLEKHAALLLPNLNLGAAVLRCDMQYGTSFTAAGVGPESRGFCFRPQQCVAEDTARRDAVEADALLQKHLQLRVVANQMVWQSCWEQYLLQPFIPDMRNNEYRSGHSITMLGCLSRCTDSAAH